METFDFGQAIKHLKSGNKVARSGWNGKGMFLVLLNFDKQYWNIPEFNNQEYPLLNSIAMKTATNEILIGWLASQTDMLAEDWILIEKGN